MVEMLVGITVQRVVLLHRDPLIIIPLLQLNYVVYCHVTNNKNTYVTTEQWKG